MNHSSVRKIVTLSMLAALAYLCVVTIRIPVALGFLSYEPKDVVLAMAGILYDPVSACLVTLAVCIVEMLTVSSTGFIGLFMNVLSSLAFLLPVSVLYHKKKSLPRALLGLLLGVIFCTAVMILWNYLITPIYMGISRSAVVELLIPFILPFNLLKGGLNAALVLLLYKPLHIGLSRAHLLPPVKKASAGRQTVAVILLSVFLIVSFVLLILVMKGVL